MFDPQAFMGSISSAGETACSCTCGCTGGAGGGNGSGDGIHYTFKWPRQNY